MRRRAVQKCPVRSFRRSSCRDLVGFGGDLGARSLGFDSLQNLKSAFAVALPAEQPARAFGKAKAEDRIEQRGKRGYAEHPAPGILADPRQQRVRNKCDQNSENDVELEHAGKAAAMLGRRDLRDVHGSDHGRDADAQPADHARHDEHGDVGCQARAHRADEIKNADPEQSGLAPEAVGGPAPEQGTDHGAVKRRGHGNAVQSGTEPPKSLNGFFGAGNDDGVEAEEKSGKRRGERPEEDATIHKWVAALLVRDLTSSG